MPGYTYIACQLRLVGSSGPNILLADSRPKDHITSLPNSDSTLDTPSPVDPLEGGCSCVRARRASVRYVSGAER